MSKMADCQTEILSDVDNSYKNDIKSNDIPFILHGGNDARVLDSDTGNQFDIDRLVSFEEDQRGNSLHPQNTEHSSNRYLPRLVFLDSDETLPDGDIQNEIDSRRQIRAVSDGAVTNCERDKSLLQQTHECTSNPLYPNRHNKISQASLQSSDSELLLDHSVNEISSLPGDEDFERFIMEYPTDHPKLKTWHCHNKGPENSRDNTARNQLIAVSCLCFIFMIGETIGGVLSNSLALFTDVLHLGSDLVSFLISLLAIYLSKKPATKHMSFGYHRTEVLGALFSVFIIWMVTGILVYMAVERIQHEHYKNVKADEMLITAVLGVIFNIVMGLVLHSELCFRGAGSTPMFGHGHSHGSGHGHSHGSSSHNHESENSHGKSYYTPNHIRQSSRLHSEEEEEEEMTDRQALLQNDHSENPAKERQKNINVRAAFIHVVGDIIQSLGVLLAALIIKIKPEEKYRLADPICTFLFSILVLFTTITVLRDTLLIIMEGVPRDVDYYFIKTSLQKLEGVKAVHGLTIWCLTLEKNAMAVHLAVDKGVNHKLVLCDATEMLRTNFALIHSTIQIEDYMPELMAGCASCNELRK